MGFLEVVERAELECDLVFTRTGEHRYGLLGGTLRPPQRGTLALGSSWYKPSPWQTLRVAVHTYLSLAVNISGSHFCWSEENERMVCSALGERLLLCLDLYCYEEEMRARDILDSLRSAVFVESAHFKFFQDLLVPQAELIKGSGKHLYLEKHRLGIQTLKKSTISWRSFRAQSERPLESLKPQLTAQSCKLRSRP